MQSARDGPYGFGRPFDFGGKLVRAFFDESRSPGEHNVERSAPRQRPPSPIPATTRPEPVIAILRFDSMFLTSTSIGPPNESTGVLIG